MDTLLEREYDKTGALIRASEDWSTDYTKNPEIFGKLLKTEAKMERLFYGYLSELANERAAGYINWNAYNQRLSELKADSSEFNVEVLVSDDLPGHEDQLVLQVLYDATLTAAQLGVMAGELEFGIPLGDAATNVAVSKAAGESIAQLVGKKVTKNGDIIDNPSAKYRVSDETRKRIMQSVKTSLALYEDQEQATKRMQEVIKDKVRAHKIAATESVNAYQGGRFNYALQSGATEKKLRTAPGACPRCLTNASVGVIPINDPFPSGQLCPAFHPYDHCSVTYLYPKSVTE